MPLSVEQLPDTLSTVPPEETQVKSEGQERDSGPDKCEQGPATLASANAIPGEQKGTDCALPGSP